MNRVPPKSFEEIEAVEAEQNINLGKITINNNKNPTKMSNGLFPGFKKNLFEYLVEYSNNSSIQGIQYMGEKTRPVFERLAWLFFFCISFYFCIILINQTYIKWEISPAVLSFARSPTPVWQIPFPAITICSECKAKSSLFNYTEAYYKVLDKENITQEKYKNFCDMALICDGYSYQSGNLTTGYEAIDFFINIAPQLDDIMWNCEYPAYNSKLGCGDLFVPTITEEGLCFTFNAMEKTKMFRDNVIVFRDINSYYPKPTDWTLEKGYSKNAPIDTHPRRALSVGFHSRFVIVLTTVEEDLDYVCSGAVQGFKILLHNPAELPNIGMHFYRAPRMQELTLAVKPDMISTSDSLKKYDPHRRQCYFSEERYLTFFRSYTQQSCQFECLTNFTKAKCGCIGHNMPHERGTPICGSGRRKCMIEARYELIIKEAQMEIDKEESDISKPSECDCLPGCTSLVYNSEVSQADFDGDYNNFKAKVTKTKINIYFKEPQFIRAERNELYGSTDFIANCGGFLGLFTGFSFLSFVEVIYFLSLRLLCNVKRYGTHYWSGSQELVTDDENENRNVNLENCC